MAHSATSMPIGPQCQQRKAALAVSFARRRRRCGSRLLAAAKDGILMADDVASQLEGTIAIVILGGAERSVENVACELRRGDGLERGDQFTCLCEPLDTLIIATDVGGLEGEIDAACGRVGLFGRQNLFAEQEARVGGEFDARLGAKPDRGAVD